MNRPYYSSRRHILAPLLLVGLLAPTSASAESTLIRGVILDEKDKSPVAGAVITTIPATGTALTAADGTFELPRSEPSGPVMLKVIRSGYQGLEMEVGSDSQEIRLLLSPEGSDGAIVVTERENTMEPIIRQITAKEIQKIPGAFGDPVRVTQNLPGVARSPALSLGSGLIVRGTEPEDTGIYVDGIRVPSVFHFGGLVTIINSQLLEHVKFIPGGFGVEYGRNMGGVVDIETSESLFPDDIFSMDVDLIDGTLFYARSLGNKSGIAISARRSYMDLVLSPFLNLNASDEIQFQLPVYDDYQVLYNQRVGDKHQFHTLLFGSRDRFEITNADDEALLDYGVVNHKFLSTWTYNPNSRLTQKMTVGAGPDSTTIDGNIFVVDTTPFSFFLRDDLYYEATPWLHLQAGVDALFQFYDFELTLPTGLGGGGGGEQGGEDEGGPTSFEDVETETTQLSALVLSASPYLESRFFLGPVTLTPGLRLDPTRVWDRSENTVLLDQFSVDPRLNLRWRVMDSLAVKGSMGRYSNGIPPYALFPNAAGGDDLTAEWARQFTVGAEWSITDALTLDGSLYHSQLNDLIALDFVDNALAFTQKGGGRNQGAEFLLRYDGDDDDFFGWVSYTLNQAQRNDDIANACVDTGDVDCSPWYLYDSDQTHILRVVGTKKLPGGWEAGFRFSYSTGVPYTPVESASYNADTDSYDPFEGDLNSARNPSYHQLDLRIDKAFEPRWGDLSAYLEVQNIYNRKNVESISYSADYSEEIYTYGLPIFPSFGVKAEF